MCLSLSDCTRERSCTDYLACFFVIISREDTLGAARHHYATSPWMSDDEDTDAWVWYEVLVRALYWALMTLTTVGHVDKMTSYERGADWEYLVGIIIMLVAICARAPAASASAAKRCAPLGRATYLSLIHI